MVATKLRVDDKITACDKQICFLCVICKVSKRKTLTGETFSFLEKRLLSIFKLAHNQLFFWNVLLFSCNLIGQLCLSGPGYCGRTVSQPTLTPAVKDLSHSLHASIIVPCFTVIHQ